MPNPDGRLAFSVWKSHHRILMLQHDCYAPNKANKIYHLGCFLVCFLLRQRDSRFNVVLLHSSVVCHVTLGSVVHIKCGKTVLIRPEHFHRKIAFISDKTRNSHACLLSIDTQMQTYKRQINSWSNDHRKRGTGHIFSHDSTFCWVTETCHQPIQTNWVGRNIWHVSNLSLQLLKRGKDKPTQVPNTGLLTIKTAPPAWHGPHP